MHRGDEQFCSEPVSQVRVRAAPPVPAPLPTEEFTAMLPIVQMEVARFLRRLPRSVMREDLMSAGSIGLLVALRRSTGPRDATFGHYVRIRVRGAILDELRREDWLSRADRARRRAGVSAAHVVYTEDLPDGAGDVESRAESPADGAARRMSWFAVADAMRALPPREREILERIYLRGSLVKDVAHAMGVSVPRISQLHARAVGRLREQLASRDALPVTVQGPVPLAG